mmetsp:Transcript_78156/g.203626  ORF Transcript_78156/g.203626 Transcript_78156/m.203626 type:complete len:282 (-) Transcript_78156:166-1011(-)
MSSVCAAPFCTPRASKHAKVYSSTAARRGCSSARNCAVYTNCAPPSPSKTTLGGPLHASVTLWTPKRLTVFTTHSSPSRASITMRSLLVPPSMFTRPNSRSKEARISASLRQRQMPSPPEESRGFTTTRVGASSSPEQPPTSLPLPSTASARKRTASSALVAERWAAAGRPARRRASCCSYLSLLKLEVAGSFASPRNLVLRISAMQTAASIKGTAYSTEMPCASRKSTSTSAFGATRGSTMTACLPCTPKCRSKAWNLGLYPPSSSTALCFAWPAARRYA